MKGCALTHGAGRYQAAAEPVNLDELKISEEEDEDVEMEDVGADEEEEGEEEEEDDAALEDIKDLYEDEDDEGTRKKRKRKVTDDGEQKAKKKVRATIPLRTLHLNNPIKREKVKQNKTVRRQHLKNAKIPVENQRIHRQRCQTDPYKPILIGV